MKRTLRQFAPVILIALIPCFYLIANPSFGENQAGDVDLWFYYGLAKSFWYHLGHDFYNDYYETRLAYIIPAALIFAIPNDRIASFVFSYLVYSVTAFSFFYVLSRWVSRTAALLATIIMASDIFFMRSVGWQYVDNGVLAYTGLTYAALTAGRDSPNRYAFVVLSGFFFTSILVVHLGAVPLVLPLAAYALFVFDARRMPFFDLVRLFLCATFGAVSCQVFYGLLNMLLYHTEFFFEKQQIIAGMISQKNPIYFDRLSILFTYGWWLTVHVAVWFAAAALIVATLARAFRPTKFQVYCMWTVFSTYSILFVFDYFKLTIYSGRSGLYASFFLLSSYLFVGSIIPAKIRMPTVVVGGGLFILSLLVRWEFAPGLAQDLHATSVLVIGIALGALITVIAVVKNGPVRLVAMAAAVLLSLPIWWQFVYRSSIYSARQAIAAVVGRELPYFAFSDRDPAYGPVIIGLVGSFTARAWWIRCEKFPDCLPHNIGRRSMFVISSEANSARLYGDASVAMAGTMLSEPKLIYRAGSEFSVYRFDIHGWPIIPADQLDSQVGTVEGHARVATEGTSHGALTYGPYASMDAGKYQVTIQYQSQGETGVWDVVSDRTSLVKGPIPDSRGAIADITTTINLPDGAEGFQVRTFYSGHGRLTVFSLRLEPLAQTSTDR